jgi:hypothetical protein
LGLIVYWLMPAATSPPRSPAVSRAGLAALFAAVAATILALTAVSAPASAGGTPPVDPYQPYVPKQVSHCHPNTHFVQQPGAVEFKDMIMAQVGGGNYGIFACSGYEHEEGRAWDWKVSVTVPAENEMVDLVLDWLTTNQHEMARRVGLAYIIWNDRYLGLSAGEPHLWEDYLACRPGQSSASVCHTNHVHFAFSWAGARRETTWYTTNPRPTHWLPRRSASTPPAEPSPGASATPSPGPTTEPTATPTSAPAAPPASPVTPNPFPTGEPGPHNAS